jgi:hypothetical protein
MPTITTSTLLLTLLLGVGLIFFLRAASKDRTTVVELTSSRPPLEVLDGLAGWLQRRGWSAVGGDPSSQRLRFEGDVEASPALALLLGGLASFGAAALALVLCQLLPAIAPWPLMLILLGPLASVIYRRRARRRETLELRLLAPEGPVPTTLRLRAHRDELIALEQQLGRSLNLRSDGRLLHSPI